MEIELAFGFCGKCQQLHRKTCMGGACGCYEKRIDFMDVIKNEQTQESQRQKIEGEEASEFDDN